MSSDPSSEAPRITAWLHRHNPARSSHWPWSSSESSRPEHLHVPTSATEIKSRLRNFVRRHSHQSLPALPPLARFDSRRTVPSNTATSEPPPPYSPPTDIPPSPPAQGPLGSSPIAESFISPPGIDDDTPPPGYRNPVGPRQDRAVADAIEASLNEERQRLEAVFTLYPWDQSWGPRPLTLNEALKRAALLGNQRLVLTLLDAGAQIRSNDRDTIPEDSPVHSALYGSNPKIALDLLRHESVSAQARKDLLESRNTLGLTPLHIAVEAGETEVAREIIELGSSVDAVDRFGRTSLHIAARHGRTETLDMLLDQGADSKINRQLWIRAADCGHSQDALGQYGSISRALQDALDRWGERIRVTARERRMSVGQASLAPSFISQSGGSLIDFNTETNEYRGARDRRSWASSIENHRPIPAGTYSSLLDDTDLPASLPRQAQHRPVTISTNSFLLRRYPGSLHGHSHSDGQFTWRHSRGGGGPSTPRRKAVPQTLVYTPEYLRWRRGCEALQAESRAQREKNKMIEEGIMGRR
ncbi:hypothetical protein V8F20_009196 [Naviculisporaceae sp. PSN 640]